MWSSKNEVFVVSEENSVSRIGYDVTVEVGCALSPGAIECVGLAGVKCLLPFCGL